MNFSRKASRKPQKNQRRRSDYGDMKNYRFPIWSKSTVLDSLQILNRNRRSHLKSLGWHYSTRELRDIAARIWEAANKVGVTVGQWFVDRFKVEKAKERQDTMEMRRERLRMLIQKYRAEMHKSSDLPQEAKTCQS